MSTDPAIQLGSALTDWRNRQSRTIDLSPFMRERCRLCAARLQRWPESKQSKHLRSIPHIAAVYGVFVWDLARAVQGVRLLDGTYEEKKRKAPGWQRRLTPEQAVKRAREMLAQHEAALKSEQECVRKWRRRLKDAIRRTPVLRNGTASMPTEGQDRK